MIVEDWGLIDYEEAVERQLARHAAVLAGGEDTLFVLEHPKVITLGRQGGAENLHVGREFLRTQGIALAQTTRGGNITCHFPGQLVAYPILRVEKRPGGIRKLFFDLEEAVIRTCARFGVAAERREGYPGVWTAGGKICSIGIAVKRWVTYHGIALNVGPDVSLFDLITLCGIQGARPTSLALERGAEPNMREVKDVIAQEFRTLFAHSAVA